MTGYVHYRVVATGLGCEGLKILVEALKENHTVTDLRWTVGKKHNFLVTNTHMLHLTQCLQYCSFIRMAINKIGDDGAGYLAELLRTNCTLTDIRWLRLIFVIAVSLINYLSSVFTVFKHFAFNRLRDNLVTDKGAEVLMAALKGNTTLEYLW